MSINVNPYLQFPGTAREAMTFYASVLGGELGLSTLGDFGMGEGEAAGRVMHSQLVIDDRAFLMGADQMEGLPVNAGPIGTVALFGGVEDAAEMEKRWEALADGATIVEPMAQAPWGDRFGMLTDRFGVLWMVNIGGEPQE